MRKGVFVAVIVGTETVPVWMYALSEAKTNSFVPNWPLLLKSIQALTLCCEGVEVFTEME